MPLPCLFPGHDDTEAFFWLRPIRSRTIHYLALVSLLGAFLWMLLVIFHSSLGR
jgi:hypothetical protein